ncbi:MAG TPA: hypothetical protein GXX28_02710 [Firmicutes bacterium]|nr:hypothetical protein [Bacillota bacterium]
MADGLQIGQRIQLKAATSDNEWYPSRVEDLTEATVVVGAPLKGGVVVPFPVGGVLDCQYAKDDAFYGFQTTVLERRRHPLPILVLRRPKTVQRFQRRRMYRLPVVLPVVYKPVDGEETHKGNTLDLSGGGLCLATDERLERDTELELSFALSDGYAVEARGRVVLVNESRDGQGPPRYLHGVAFRELPEAIQERIVSFIFAEQRERRRRQAGLT